MINDATLINLLCCPACGGDCRIGELSEVASDGHVIAGTLACVACNVAYPIRGGVPRFFQKVLSREVLETINGFSYQWRRANPVIRDTRFTSSETFLSFIDPVTPEYFRGKCVLDAGCGAGRFTALAQQYGARAVVGVDLSDSVDVAFENTRSLPNVLIVQGDLFAMPLRQRFDYVFSVGVLHHTPDPRRAFDAIVGVVQPGGGVSVWVYGREGNGWVIYVLDPLRRSITSRLPRGVLLALAYVITVPIFVVTKGVYGPVGRSRRLSVLKRWLFYFDYLLFLSRFGWHEQAYVVFDHLAPALAAYVRKEEFAAWFRENWLEGVAISSRAGNSWRGFGVRPAAGEWSAEGIVQEPAERTQSKCLGQTT